MKAKFKTNNVASSKAITVAMISSQSTKEKEYGSFNVERSENEVIIDMEEAIERLGMGLFQTQILFAAGLCFAADAMEVLLLSFLSVILQAEWGLSETKMNTIISVVFAGAMVGTLVLSPLGDIMGRRPIFTFTAATISIFGVATALCQSYEWLLVSRFMVGFGVGGLTIPFDTLAEFVPTSQRGTHLLAIEFFWTAGTLLVPVIAWYTLGDAQHKGSWQIFVFLCAIPCIISTILGMVLVPESPRWLMTKGRKEEALHILRVAATRNGLDAFKTFPEGTQLINKNGDLEDRGSVSDLLAPKMRKLILSIWGVWAGLAFLYYGTILEVSIVFTKHIDNEDDDFEGFYEFDYSAIIISASSEIVGLIIVIFTIDRFGRIPTQVVSYLLGGLACLALGMLGFLGSSRWSLLLMAFCSRMAMMGASCTTWCSTAEIIPTNIRASGHGTANAVARIGGFFCPYIISEHVGLNWIGILMFTASVITASIAWQLPETAGRAMGDMSTINMDKSKSEKQNLSRNSESDTPYQVF